MQLSPGKHHLYQLLGKINTVTVNCNPFLLSLPAFTLEYVICVKYPFGHLGSAVPGLSPAKLLMRQTSYAALSYLLVARQEKKQQKLDAVQALVSNS